MTYRLTRPARRDILAIWVHIAEDNEPAADRFVDLLVHHFQLLGKHPSLPRDATRRENQPRGARPPRYFRALCYRRRNSFDWS